MSGRAAAPACCDLPDWQPFATPNVVPPYIVLVTDRFGDVQTPVGQHFPFAVRCASCGSLFFKKAPPLSQSEFGAL